MRSRPLARRHRHGQQRVNIESSIQFFFIPNKFILNINRQGMHGAVRELSTAGYSHSDCYSDDRDRQAGRDFVLWRGMNVGAHLTVAEAAENGDVGLVRRLAQECEDHEITRALYHAAEVGHLEVVKVLVELGADVNGSDVGTGVTPVCAASHNGHADVAFFLARECGADVMKESHDGITPLSGASQDGHVELVRFLIHEAIPKQSISSRVPPSQLARCLIEAADTDREQIVREVLDYIYSATPRAPGPVAFFEEICALDPGSTDHLSPSTRLPTRLLTCALRCGIEWRGCSLAYMIVAGDARRARP
jgi:hypothetical protein